jgi:hypothetical protein
MGVAARPEHRQDLEIATIIAAAPIFRRSHGIAFARADRVKS